MSVEYWLKLSWVRCHKLSYRCGPVLEVRKIIVFLVRTLVKLRVTFPDQSFLAHWSWTNRAGTSIGSTRRAPVVAISCSTIWSMLKGVMLNLRSTMRRDEYGLVFDLYPQGVQISSFP